MPFKTMNEFFVGELQRLYGQEKQIVRILPKLSKATTSPELRKVLADHVGQAESDVKRIEDVFTAIGERAKTGSCPRVEGLCKECEKVAALEGDPHIRDVAMIATTQHFAHDQIAGYGCARTWANLLGRTREANILQKILDDKKRLDTQLSKLSEQVNKEAMALSI